MNLRTDFWLNGQKFYVKKQVTLFDIVTYFNYSHSLLVLEHNNLICNRTSWGKICVSNFDQIEIVTIVGGG